MPVLHPELFAEAVELGNRMSQPLRGARPLRWAALHFSEHARHQYLPDEAEAWRAVLYPVYGAFTTLLRHHLPVGIVTDSRLEQDRLDGYRVLFLPAAEASAAFLAALGAAGPAPVQINGAPAELHAVSFTQTDEDRLIVALVNAFDWVHTGRVDDDTEIQTSPPPPIDGVTIELSRPDRPLRVYDAVTDRPLDVRQVGERWQIALHRFDCNALVVIDYRSPL